MINLIDTSYRHIAFYYYGFEHLLLNLYYYAQDAITNNELIRLSVSQELYENIKINFIYKEGLPDKYFEYKPAIKKINNATSNYYKLKTHFNKSTKAALNKGFNGIRCIGDIKYEIEKTSKEKVLMGEKKLTNIFKNINGSMLCLYDIEDYAKNKVTIDDEVIKASYHTHPYILKKFQISKFTGGF